MPERRRDRQVGPAELAALEVVELDHDVALVRPRLVRDHRDGLAVRRHDRLAHPGEPRQLAVAEAARLEVLRRSAAVDAHAHEVRDLHVICSRPSIHRPEAAGVFGLDVVDVLPVRRPRRHRGIRVRIVGQLDRSVRGLDPDVSGLGVGDRPGERRLVLWRLGDDDDVRWSWRAVRPVVAGAAVAARRLTDGEGKLPVEQGDGEDRDDQQADDRQARSEKRPDDAGPVRVTGARRIGADRVGHAGATASGAAGSVPTSAVASGCEPDKATSRMSSCSDS